MEKLSDLERQRHIKLERIREGGIDPYPPRAQRSHTAAEALQGFETDEPEGEISLVGRLMSVRVMGKSTFAHIEDGSGRIQVYLRRDTLGEEAYEFFKKRYSSE